MQLYRRETEVNGRTYSIETGMWAKQANGSAVVRLGDTMVLVTVCVSKEMKDGQDFFPLQVEYREKAYAAGKIPGGFFKRESKPSEKEVLSARCVDRPIRPLFPEGFMNDTQVMAMIISQDQENDADMLAITGASLALCVSDIPFGGPVAGVRVALVDDKFIVSPTFEEVERSAMDMVVAGSKDSILMVEGGAFEVSEDTMIQGIMEGHKAIKKLCALQEEIAKECGKQKFVFVKSETDPVLKGKVKELVFDKLKAAYQIAKKEERRDSIEAIKKDAVSALEAEYPEQSKLIISLIHDLEAEIMRGRILEEGIRIDGRKTNEIRKITCQSKVLPRAHGSAVFTRGETQGLVVTTLGTKLDEQKIDALHGESWKDYMFHYNFPPFSTGEAKPVRATGRREIGHGHLAERSLAAVLPSKDKFPYTIRIVSDILESNGSSSMASVCGGSLSLMDAGVPIKSPVAGIAMGLIKEGDRTAILSDILGDEDHLGDMDFKVTGTREGITAFQMDIKIDGITPELMKSALEQAKAGRIHILGKMDEELNTPRTELSKYAPRILHLKVAVEDIGAIIGPGGKIIKEIQEKTGAVINIDDDGTVLIASTGGLGGPEAKAWIERITMKPEIGKVYQGTVKGIQNFGCFVEFMPGREGLVHISELAAARVNKVEDIVNVGDTISVKLIDIDPLSHKVRLSKKQAE
ncbi:MAG: polyribonucleotide nucleotidyltransferase [Fibrobacteres bacterium]|nr:polyribonucleotide nucleotidyltransferase [Fibrobacterota bacterium]